MRVSELTRFPHPVLSVDSRDFGDSTFDVSFDVEEDLESGALRIRHSVDLEAPSIRELVTSGVAVCSCFVSCGDTYYSELRKLSWPQGINDFVAGTLQNRVSLRPIIYMDVDLGDWNPPGLHPEFEPPVALRRGDIIGVAPEYVVSVGMAKLAPIESIFELRISDTVAEGFLKVDPYQDRLQILSAPGTFATINLLRGQVSGQPVVMSAVYLPAVMEILSALSAEKESFADRRWYKPFTAKCDALGLDIGPDISVLESAQQLLEGPLAQLSRLTAEGV